MVNQTDVYDSLATKLAFPGNKLEYMRKLLEVAHSPEEAELLNLLPTPREAQTRRPLTLRELAKELKKDEQWVKNTLHEKYVVGWADLTPAGYTLFLGWEGTSAAHVTQQPSKELLDAYRERWLNDESVFTALPGETYPTRRIYAHWRSIENVPGKLPFDDIREVLKAQRGLFLMNCPCRMIMRNCDAPLDVCIHFTSSLGSIVARGHVREITYDDALVALDKMEEAGLVIGAGNTRMSDDMHGLCAHCACCCHNALRDKITGEKLWWSHHVPSRFRATVDEQLCDGCQTCVTRCQNDAIKMVQVPGAKKLKATVSAEDCIGCGSCAVKCPAGALTMKVVRPPEFVRNTHYMDPFTDWR